MDTPRPSPRTNRTRRGSTQASSSSDAALISVCRRLLDRIGPYEGDSRLRSLVAALRRHVGGLSALVWDFNASLLERYVDVESRFSGKLDAREEVPPPPLPPPPLLLSGHAASLTPY